MAELLNLPVDGSSILCHAWNQDKTQIALSANSKDVVIFTKSANKWTLSHVLSEHTSKVLGIDWAPVSNRIVTCGADKNAYVWNFDGKQWKPDLVILRINRAATCCKWSPNEKKFAVGCGTKCICICYYETKQQFWASKHIKKPLKSTVTCLDWHPDSSVIACGGTDYKCRVFYAHVDEVDGSAPSGNAWVEKQASGDCLHEYGSQSSGWVYSVSFNTSGNRLTWVGHDSTIYLVDIKLGTSLVTYRTPFLPFLTVKFLTESTLVAAGFDCYPIVFSTDGASIKLVEKLLVKQTSASQTKFSALAKFSNMDRINSEASSSSDQNTIHQNPIKQINVLDKGKMTSCGLDGNVVVWDFRSLENEFKSLKIN